MSFPAGASDPARVGDVISEAAFAGAKGSSSMVYRRRACVVKQVYALSFSTDSKGVFYGT